MGRTYPCLLNDNNVIDEAPFYIADTAIGFYTFITDLYKLQ